METNKTPTQPKYVRVQVVLDAETKRMIAELVAMRSTPDRQYNNSSIIRRSVRTEYRAEQRRQQRKAEQATA